MSPNKIFQSCGSSSIRHLRIVFPHLVMRGSLSEDNEGPSFSASLTMDLNLYIVKGLPLYPILSWEYRMGPCEENLNLIIEYNNSGDKTIRPDNAHTTSSRRLTGCCQAGIRSVFRSINGAPSILFVFTEPERISSISGWIFISTS